MSRYKETMDTIDNLKTSMIGNVDKPVLYTLPLLSQIALSLAIIADDIKEKKDER